MSCVLCPCLSQLQSGCGSQELTDCSHVALAAETEYLCALEQAAGLWRSLGPDSEVKHEAGPAASSWAGAALCLPWSR